MNKYYVNKLIYFICLVSKYVFTYCFVLFYTEWPWYESSILRNFRDWMFLPDPDSPPDAYKLLCKFKYNILFIYYFK